MSVEVSFQGTAVGRRENRHWLLWVERDSSLSAEAVAGLATPLAAQVATICAPSKVSFKAKLTSAATNDQSEV